MLIPLFALIYLLAIYALLTFVLRHKHQKITVNSSHEIS